MITRRKMLEFAASLCGTMAAWPWDVLPSCFFVDRRFSIAACDWSIGKRGSPEALELAREIGLDGVQVSFTKDADSTSLSHPLLRKTFLEKARQTGVQIGGIALGILNQIPYKSDPRAEQWVLESISAAKMLGVKVVLLAFFGDGSIKGDKAGTKTVIERLKRAAPLAQEAGVILGIESWLSADEHLQIIDAVQSDNVRVYYDVANSHKMGYNIYDEIRQLGSEYICEFHLKENGFLLGQGLIDFKELRRAINDIAYEGWLVIEGARPEGANILESYRSNNQFVRSLF